MPPPPSSPFNHSEWQIIQWLWCDIRGVTGDECLPQIPQRKKKHFFWRDLKTLKLTNHISEYNSCYETVVTFTLGSSHPFRSKKVHRFLLCSPSERLWSQRLLPEACLPRCLPWPHLKWLLVLASSTDNSEVTSEKCHSSAQTHNSAAEDGTQTLYGNGAMEGMWKGLSFNNWPHFYDWFIAHLKHISMSFKVDPIVKAATGV